MIWYPYEQMKTMKAPYKIIDAEGVYPVSYTHLDVYKRQKLGIMICYDREYPESARILMLKGAEIILVPNDCGSMQDVYKRQLYDIAKCDKTRIYR